MSRRGANSVLAIAGAVLAGAVGAAAVVGAEGKQQSKIDPKAEQCLRQSCSYLAGLQNFSFRVDEINEEMDDDGQKIQYANRRHVIVSRPNRLAAEATGDTANRQFVYDGKTVTLYDREHNVYGTDSAPDSMDAMLEDLNRKFGYTPPLADFFFSDPYKALTDDVQSGRYVGIGTVGDTRCHHLAFRQRAVDWQIWIAEGDKPLPRKLVITYKREAGEPEFTAIFARWDTSPPVRDTTFTLKAPDGVQKIDFIKAHEEATRRKPLPGK